MLPALRLLREKYADAVIEVLTITESAAPLRQLPYIDAVHCFRRRAGTLRRIWQTIRVMNLIRKKCFDLAINLQASSGSEILTLCSGARKRLIYPYAYGKWSAFSHVKIAKPRKVQQSVMEDIAALYPLGIREQHASFYYPISERIRKKTSEILRAHGIAPGRYIVIHPGGGASEKQWLAAHYGSLIGAIHEVFALPSVVVFTDKEQQRYARIAAVSSPKPIGLEVPFDLLAGIIEQCLAFIGSDSAPHHVACTLDIPSIVLMPRDRKATWHPYDETYHRVLVGGLKTGKERRIDRITPAEVLGELKDLIRSSRSSHSFLLSCDG